jgi:hypothetical protein
MEELAEIRISRLPMEEQPDLLWAPMEQLELSWAPDEQKDQGLHGLLADQQLRLASAAASIGLQVTRKDILIYFSGVLRGHRLNLDGKGSIFTLLLQELMREQRKPFFSSKNLSAFVLIESDRVEKTVFSPGNVGCSGCVGGRPKLCGQGAAKERAAGVESRVAVRLARSATSRGAVKWPRARARRCCVWFRTSFTTPPS